MINAGEVGAVFRIVDEGSPVLKRLMDQFNSLQGMIERTQAALKTLVVPPGLSRSLGIMEQRFQAIADASKVTGDVASASFAKIDSATAATAANLGAISKEMKAIAAESRAINGPASLRTGGYRRGGGGEGTHFSGATVPLPGGHLHLPNTGGIAAIGALGYGMYEESKIEGSAQRLFTTSGQKFAGPMADDPRFKQVRDAIIGAYSMSGMPLDDITHASEIAMQQLAGMSFDEKIALLPTLFEGATVEARQKHTSVDRGMEAIIGLAHMERRYQPGQIEKIIKDFAYLSSVDPVSIEGITRAAGYPIPTLVSGGYDPDEIMLSLVAMQRGGILNTKAGTWLREFGIKALPGSSLMSKVAYQKHEAALRELGLVDGHDGPTFLDAQGNPQFLRMIQIAADNYAKMAPYARLVNERQLFGAQGGGALAFLGDPIVQGLIKNTQTELKQFPGAKDYWENATQNAPDVVFRKTWADMTVVLMDLGTKVLPPVVAGLRGFDDVLKSMHKNLPGPVADTAIGGLVFAGLASMFSGGRALIGSVGRGAGSLLGGSAIMRLLGPLGWAYAAKEGADYLDPGGNFWGLTAPIDNWLRNNVKIGGSAADNKVADSLYAAGYGYNGIALNAEMSREASRGRALSGPPQVKTTVNVYVDGKLIPSTSRVINDSSGFDGRADTPYPDHGFH